MTSIEQEAREWVVDTNSGHFDPSTKTNTILIRLEDQLASFHRYMLSKAESADPVAWMDANGRIIHDMVRGGADELGTEIFHIPLYTHLAPKSASPAASGQGVEVEGIRITLEKCRDAFDLKADDFEDKYYPQAGPTGIIADINVAIKRLSSLAADRWIAVSERLPANKEKVLCLTPYGRHTDMFYEQATDQDDEWFRKRYTHWMPLPNAPTARGEEVDGGGGLGVALKTAPVPSDARLSPRSSETDGLASPHLRAPNATQARDEQE